MKTFESEDLIVEIDGERIEIDEVHDYGVGHMITGEGREWVLFEDSDEAGKKAREYWADEAEHDPNSFTEMVGAETLIQWGLGRAAGPGSTMVNSLEEWLDLWLNNPEEHFASYDSNECEVDAMSTALLEEIGEACTVAYRTN